MQVDRKWLPGMTGMCAFKYVRWGSAGKDIPGTEPTVLLTKGPASWCRSLTWPRAQGQLKVYRGREA